MFESRASVPVGASVLADDDVVPAPDTVLAGDATAPEGDAAALAERLPGRSS